MHRTREPENKNVHHLTNVFGVEKTSPDDEMHHTESAIIINKKTGYENFREPAVPAIF